MLSWLKGMLSDFFDWIAGWLQSLLEWVVDLFKTAFKTAWAMLQDLVVWVLDSIFDLVIYMIEGLGLAFDFLDVTQYITALPPEVANMLSLVGIPQAMFIIAAAIVAKLILQIIPFTRLGS